MQGTLLDAFYTNMTVPRRVASYIAVRVGATTYRAADVLALCYKYHFKVSITNSSLLPNSVYGDSSLSDHSCLGMDFQCPVYEKQPVSEDKNILTQLRSF
ncbi:hypothetical protein TNCV_816111 [Trichonephila clavipes]|nr:hypothetical protein TNCV_816111 [Trichonephila clavipes]